MSETRMKIKELARNLGVSSRQLIERCKAEGLHVQNSVTKLRPNDVRRVRSWFEGSPASPSNDD